MCIVEVWFGIAYGQISSNFDRCICPRHSHISFTDDNFSKCQGISTKLGTCIDMIEIWFGLANGQTLSTFDRVISPRNTILARYYSLTFLFNNSKPMKDNMFFR